MNSTRSLFVLLISEARDSHRLHSGGGWRVRRYAVLIVIGITLPAIAYRVSRQQGTIR